MLKIFLTGDNHIGLKYARHEQASVLADARLNAFDGMVETANKEACDLFVIAGDLFESTRGTAKQEMNALLEKLSGFHGTVIVLPGNHDYYDREVKVWQYFTDLVTGYDNIMLLKEYRPYQVSVNGMDGTLYPAHCTSLHSAPGKNNLDWIRETDMPEDDTYRIGIAHGAVAGETIDREGAYFLMTREELESIPVDVWLIGHTHVPFPKDLPADRYMECGRIFNAGTHVQTDCSCNTEGNCFIIEISPDKKVRAKRVVTGTLRFIRKEIGLKAGQMQTALEAELAPIPDSSVVELILSGAVSAEEYDAHIPLLDSLLNRFIEGTFTDYELGKVITKELIAAEFPEYSFSAKLLTALMTDPKEAQMAYELLKDLENKV